jgi:hypothetical protein
LAEDELMGHVVVRLAGAWASFDHFVGAGEERGWDSKAERLGVLEVDGQLEFDRPLDRNIVGLVLRGTSRAIWPNMAALLNCYA